MKLITAPAVLFALLGCMVVNGDYYTSITELETLLPTLGKLTKAMDTFVQVEIQRLETLKRIGKEYHKMYDSAIGNAEAFLSNPVHAYLLVKHLTADWKMAIELIDGSNKSISDVFNETVLMDLKIPGDYDLRGAVMALLRLQQTYLLNTTKIASGELGGTDKSWQLSAEDCYQLGAHACEDEDNEYCYLWMKEALKRIETESEPTVNKLMVLQRLVISSYLIGKVREARQINLKLIEEYPDNTEAREFNDIFNRHIREVDAGLRMDLENEERERRSGFTSYNSLMNGHYDWYEEYAKLCRGERLKELEEHGQLHCRYTSQNNSYLLLQPIKEEELCLNPRIVMYHDVISDKDMDILKELAKPMLERARVQSSDTGFSRESEDRVSQSTWLLDNDHPAVEKSSRMMQDITGLSISTAESLHIINYGIGGHYEPHLDFSQDGVAAVFAARGLGNRIATWIYYLSDVEAGGYTVFPKLGVKVVPRKGSAAFWFNLKRSGDGDLSTMHAACPVLIGSKWVANKWFHEAGNEFRRKCYFTRDE